MWFGVRLRVTECQRQGLVSTADGRGHTRIDLRADLQQLHAERLDHRARGFAAGDYEAANTALAQTLGNFDFLDITFFNTHLRYLSAICRSWLASEGVSAALMSTGTPSLASQLLYGMRFCARRCGKF
jgi:hypothetical protein